MTVYNKASDEQNMTPMRQVNSSRGDGTLYNNITRGINVGRPCHTLVNGLNECKSPNDLPNNL